MKRSKELNLPACLLPAKTLITLLIVCFCYGASAKVTLPLVFSDGMVLQQKERVALWGKGTAGKQVLITTSWNGAKTTVRTNAAGAWKAVVNTAKAGGPYTISFNDGETLLLKDILIGEVWLCSGQSNMEMPLEGWGKVLNYQQEVAAANHPNIRFLTVEKSTSTQPLKDATIKQGWRKCSPQSAADFSAVAYFFARSIQARLGVPVGLIQSAYSGTPAESWVSGASLQKMREYDSLVTVISSVPGAPQNSHIPTVLFNAMINPIVPYGIRGVLWYQGESNTAKAYQYRTLFPLLISDWRKQWGKKNLPFYFVQLANFTDVKPEPEASNWAELREAQLQTLSLPHTGMAVAIDLGEAKDIHPKNKQDVGLRLALIARSKIYGDTVAYSGPIYQSHRVEGSNIVLAFQHTNGGLTLSSGDSLTGFSIAGADQKFHWAKAIIRGDKISVSSPLVKQPIAVRYAWATNPVCNLINKARLPASPFRTDKWKGMTEPE
ncbi:MAG: sialate O-acetylesterase [Chitinophagaceae bacterium]